MFAFNAFSLVYEPYQAPVRLDFANQLLIEITFNSCISTAVNFDDLKFHTQAASIIKLKYLFDLNDNIFAQTMDKVTLFEGDGQ